VPNRARDVTYLSAETIRSETRCRLGNPAADPPLRVFTDGGSREKVQKARRHYFTASTSAGSWRRSTPARSLVSRRPAPERRPGLVEHRSVAARSGSVARWRRDAQEARAGAEGFRTCSSARSPSSSATTPACSGARSARKVSLSSKESPGRRATRLPGPPRLAPPTGRRPASTKNPAACTAEWVAPVYSKQRASGQAGEGPLCPRGGLLARSPGRQCHVRNRARDVAYLSAETTGSETRWRPVVGPRTGYLGVRLECQPRSCYGS